MSEEKSSQKTPFNQYVGQNHIPDAPQARVGNAQGRVTDPDRGTFIHAQSSTISYCSTTEFESSLPHTRTGEAIRSQYGARRQATIGQHKIPQALLGACGIR